MQQHSQSAFSLVELSIVLVILGLLTGGILGGQALIRAAELRAVTTEHSRYVSAIQIFREKYLALPGDINNATSFWGLQSATPATCRNAASTSQLTCNGDGDGFIFVSSSSAEMYRFWQHLANAGLTSGTYTGASNGLGSNETDSHWPGVNIPASRFPRGGWYVSSTCQWGAACWGSTFPQNNYMIFGANAYGATPMDDIILTPTEAWSIDTKIDDSKPGTGKVQGYANAASCAVVPPSGIPNSTVDMDIAVYDVSNVLTGPGVRSIDGCNLMFRDAF